MKAYSLHSWCRLLRQGFPQRQQVGSGQWPHHARQLLTTPQQHQCGPQRDPERAAQRLAPPILDLQGFQLRVVTEQRADRRPRGLAVAAPRRTKFQQQAVPARINVSAGGFGLQVVSVQTGGTHKPGRGGTVEHGNRANPESDPQKKRPGFPGRLLGYCTSGRITSGRGCAAVHRRWACGRGRPCSFRPGRGCCQPRTPRGAAWPPAPGRTRCRLP